MAGASDAMRSASHVKSLAQDAKPFPGSLAWCSNGVGYMRNEVNGAKVPDRRHVPAGCCGRRLSSKITP